MARFNRIHAICQYLRDDKPCEGCPAWENSDYGKVQRGCYGLAREVYRIARQGHPWSSKAPKANIKRWRKRVAARVARQQASE